MDEISLLSLFGLIKTSKNSFYVSFPSVLHPSAPPQLGQCNTKRLVSVKQPQGAIRFSADYLFGSCFRAPVFVCVCVCVFVCVCVWVHDVTAPDKLAVVRQLGGWLFTDSNRKARKVRAATHTLVSHIYEVFNPLNSSLTRLLFHNHYQSAIFKNVYNVVIAPAPSLTESDWRITCYFFSVFR